MGADVDVAAEVRRPEHLSLSTAKLARQLGVPHRTIERARAQAGLKSPARRGAAPKATADERLLLVTLRDVAERHGVEPGGVVVAGDRALSERRAETTDARR